MDAVAQITGLVGAISVMAGFIVWLFKDALARADRTTEAWKTQSQGWQEVAETNASSNKDLSTLLTQALEALKRIEASLQDPRR